MKTIGNIELSDRDFSYLVDGLAKLLPHYEVDHSSTQDINFMRQMTILHKKLQRKINPKKQITNDKK